MREADLPLNVSRELLQNNRTVEKIKSALVKRTLDLLEDLAANKPQEYAEFWKTFGVVLKEGLIEDGGQKARIAKLLRFNSTASVPDAQGAHTPDVTLDAVPVEDEAGSEGHLLPDGRHSCRGAQQPAPRSVRQVGARRCCCSRTESTSGSWATCNEYEGKKLANAAGAAADFAPAIETPEKAAAESAYKDTTSGSPRSCRARSPAHRYPRA